MAFLFPPLSLVAATNGFSADTLLGKGSHGTVYRATLDGGNLIAAVKRTKSPATHSNCTGCASCITPADNEIEISFKRTRGGRAREVHAGECSNESERKEERRVRIMRLRCMGNESEMETHLRK